ncbi:MAG: DUF1365 domain-containing protein [Rubrivivax sp.]|nr:MAG: DUF1365 domain-containing protein [Rubrivivax sp.]
MTPRPAREPASPQTLPPQAQIVFGEVRHTRLKPVRHAFAYSNYFWLLPMRQLAREPAAAVHRNRRGLLSFHDADHGLGGPDALAWLDGVLAESGLDVAALREGEAWLQTYPRVLGYAFKPVSFWWVHRADRSLAAVVAEVNNTFGERHAYVLQGAGLQLGREVQADKVFHVSPFCGVEGRYRFRFMRTGAWGQAGREPPPGQCDRIVACVDHDDDAGPVLQTSQGGHMRLLTRQSALRAFWGWPLMTWSVVWRIHWQALRVWLKGVSWHAKPETPPALLSQGRKP